MSRIEDILQRFDNDLQRNNWSNLTPKEKNSLRSDFVKLRNDLKLIDELDDKALKLFDLNDKINALRNDKTNLLEKNSSLVNKLKSNKNELEAIRRRFSSLQKSTDAKAFIELHEKIDAANKSLEQITNKFDDTLEELEVGLKPYGLSFSPLTGQVFKKTSTTRRGTRRKHFDIESKKTTKKKTQTQ